MKRLWKLSLLIALTVGILQPSKAFAAQDIRVLVDNQMVHFNNDPLVEQGTTLVEFRPLFERVGMSVDWDPLSQTVIGRKEGLTIKLTINSRSAYVNDREINLTTAPRILNGYTLIPLRFVVEYSGQRVQWQEQERTIYITTVPVNERPIYLNDNKLTAEGTADYLLGYFNAKNENGIYTTQPITLGYILGIPKKDIYFDLSSNTISFPALNVTVSENNITLNNKVIYDTGLTLENGVSYIPIRPIIESIGGKYEEKENGVYITLMRK
ncbi:MAG TPA: copper amine oxidase N-terminal domain-containing protein [Bacillota bacterium]|nr:copper amine oxidase N-terminal domain-containing protein [Bacillota bacterium]